MGVQKVRSLCTRCGTRKVSGRCPRCPLPAGERRRPYSDTALFREVATVVLERDGAVCAYPDCRLPIDGVTLGEGPRGGRIVTIDRTVADPLELAHVIAEADGGAFTPDNIRPAHRSCNRRAGRKPLGGL